MAVQFFIEDAWIRASEVFPIYIMKKPAILIRIIGPRIP
jgi:hypothetical protein